MKAILLALFLLVLATSKRMDTDHKWFWTYSYPIYTYFKHNGPQEDTPKHDWFYRTFYTYPTYTYFKHNADENKEG
jgi:hypothetical protein